MGVTEVRKQLVIWTIPTTLAWAIGGTLIMTLNLIFGTAGSIYDPLLPLVILGWCLYFMSSQSRSMSQEPYQNKSLISISLFIKWNDLNKPMKIATLIGLFSQQSQKIKTFYAERRVRTKEPLYHRPVHLHPPDTVDISIRKSRDLAVSLS
ncbi:hypothetical protein ACT691_05025 [Vibrio metschnikovii]